MATTLPALYALAMTRCSTPSSIIVTIGDRPPARNIASQAAHDFGYGFLTLQQRRVIKGLLEAERDRVMRGIA